MISYCYVLGMLEAPACLTDARCRAAWGTDSAVMALNIRACPGAVAVLRALAADAASPDYRTPK